MSQAKIRVNYSIKLGVTGGMGCGKSSATHMFAAAGFECLDSDAVVKDEVLTDPQVLDAIREKFGDAVFGADKQLNRGRLGERVFGSDDELRWLESWVHPRLFREWRRRLEGNPAGSWAIEVPLLFEKQLENWFDFIVCVASSPNQQLAWLEQRGIPRLLAEQRISKQLPLAKKIELSDFVLWNDGSIDFLQQQVDLLISNLAARS